MKRISSCPTIYVLTTIRVINSFGPSTRVDFKNQTFDRNLAGISLLFWHLVQLFLHLVHYFGFQSILKTSDFLIKFSTYIKLHYSQVFWGFPGGSDVKNLPAVRETWVRSLGGKDSLEKGMATHSSILAWRILWTEERGRLQSMGSQRVGPD